MKPNTPPHFRCLACAKIYRWRPERAGRKVLCACGLIMRCAKTPDGRPTSIGHRPPLIKPSEARVHAVVGENAVVDFNTPEWVEESTTLNLGSSDVLVDDIPTEDLNLNLDALMGSRGPEQVVPASARPEAPQPIKRPEAPLPLAKKPGSSAGLKPGSSAGLKTHPGLGTQATASQTTAPQGAASVATAPQTTAPLSTASQTTAQAGTVSPGQPQVAQALEACPSCKTKVRPGAVLCVQCGTRFKTQDQEPGTPGGQGFFSKVIKAVVRAKEPSAQPE